jgi:hypothetical protein
MGRLTLNILLSFAQFEREVTGERIRDKIAASKRKGMWMGGNVPLGYDVKDRKLIVNEDEATLVRSLFNRYLELGCVSLLKIRLDEEGLKSKVRTSAAGTKSGGTSFARGGLYKILSNRIYLGEITHKGQFHPGEHEGIVPRELWDRVETQLRSDNQGRRNGLKAESSSLLAGLLEDAQGNRLTPSHTVKNGKRYRYYVTQSTVGKAKDAHVSFVRLAAYEIESQVLSRLAAFLQSQKEVMDQLGVSEDGAEAIQRLLAAGQNTSRMVLKAGTPAEIAGFVRSVIHRVVVHREKVEVLVGKEVFRQILLKNHLPTA